MIFNQTDPLNLDALDESRKWRPYKKFPQKMIRVREINGKTIKYFILTYQFQFFKFMFDIKVGM